VKVLLALSLVLVGCASARKTASEKLGPDVECVSSSTDLAYCTLRGAAYICDTTTCVKAHPPAQVMLELDADRDRKEQDQQQTQMQMMVTP